MIATRFSDNKGGALSKTTGFILRRHYGCESGIAGNGSPCKGDFKEIFPGLNLIDFIILAIISVL